MLIPLQRLYTRIASDGEESDLAYFGSLMYLAEMVAKLVVAGMVAGIRDDKDRLRYSQLHALVRADGIGHWARQLDNILVGPPSQFLTDSARAEQRQLTEKCGAGSWQYDAVEEIHRCCMMIHPHCEALPRRVALTQAFHLIAQLRNKSPRGHGATSQEHLTGICPLLESGLNTIVENFGIFSRQWAHLHRNLSGKYRVTALSDSDSHFDYLRKTKSETWINGVYVFFDSPCHVALAATDVGANDFFLANGGYTEKRHEFISYVTGGTLYENSTPYHEPATLLPKSETEGFHTLNIRGNCFTNIPGRPVDFVSRKELENELESLLNDERHEIVTLVGSGGIGKTTLSLEVLDRIVFRERFSLIVWFSARDIELTPTGPKQVRPFVLDVKDLSREYVSLMNPEEARNKNFDAVAYLAGSLTECSFGPTLFVLDNFETVSSPLELYKWLDTYIRPPNKILITTRFRDFKGDYPVEVHGMNDVECLELIDTTSHQLGIGHLITSDYAKQLIEESDGHPYVLKILLGEVAKEKTLVRIQRIMAGQEEILTALFERTYSHLPPASQRIFLTLANWHSLVPVIAMQAVLLRIEHERINVIDAVENLARSSFVEILKSKEDGQEFIHVPLVASTFGRSKLQTSPYRAAVDADVKLLHQFGATQRTGLSHGVEANVKRFLSFVAANVEQDPAVLSEYVQILEALARRYPPTWLSIAELYGEVGSSSTLNAAKAAVQQYLEMSKSRNNVHAWKMLGDYCRQSGDLIGEAHALVELSRHENVELYEISTSANRLNALLATSPVSLERDEKSILVEGMADAFEARIDEGNATDRSRLAWLCLHLGNVAGAQRHVDAGLELDPDNQYCINLNDRLEKQRSL